MASLAVVSPLLIFSGYAFLRRKKISIALTYVWIVLIVAVFFVGSVRALINAHLAAEEKWEQLAVSFVSAIPGLAVWIPSNAYYRKRRNEFK